MIKPYDPELVTIDRIGTGVYVNGEPISTYVSGYYELDDFNRKEAIISLLQHLSMCGFTRVLTYWQPGHSFSITSPHIVVNYR